MFAPFKGRPCISNTTIIFVDTYQEYVPNSEPHILQNGWRTVSRVYPAPIHARYVSGEYPKINFLQKNKYPILYRYICDTRDR